MIPTITFTGTPLSIDDIAAIAQRRVRTMLSQAPDFRTRIEHSADTIAETLQRDGFIYGVTTGYGDSCVTAVPLDLVAELPLHLTRFHGCGMGEFLTPEQTRAVIAVRLASLCQGWSGVSMDLLERLALMLREDILPLIPSEGSVGASGDLTPLSYIAGALAGERKVLFREKTVMASEAFATLGVQPIALRPKEALAVMNGTAVMTGLAVLAFTRARYLTQVSSRLTSLACLGLLGNPAHFDARLFQAKPHPGQAACATRIATDLQAFQVSHAPSRLQDRYSLRCAPHVIGVLEDVLPLWRTQIETEINSANDNPLIDPQTGDILHGGNFYGGHIAFAMDGMKILIANIADLMDRQMALLVDTKFNNGLPANLSGATGPRSAINHGLKAVQIALSAWTAEALKLTMPASVFSRSTECHNQDKVSMGTIAARDALRVLTLTEQVAAGLTLACVQAWRLRLRAGELTPADLTPGLAAFITHHETLPFLNEDRPLDEILHHLRTAIEAGTPQLHWRETP